MPSFNFPIGSVLRAITVCQAPGQISEISRKWQLTDLTGGSTFLSTDFVQQYDNDMAAMVPNMMANAAGYYGTMVYLENPIGAKPRPDTTNANATAGTGGAGLAPTQTAGLISFYTDILGKAGQGRCYLPFPPVDEVSVDGTPTVGYQTASEAIGNYLSNDIVIVVGPVTGRFAPIMYPGGAAPVKFITSYKSHNAWATQRRRGSFGRTNSLPF